MNTLNLFDTEMLPEIQPDPSRNLLPFDGIVNDFGIIHAQAEADALFERLEREVAWCHDEAVRYGKRIVTARQVAWYGDAAFSYTYSGVTRTALVWNDLLTGIRAQVEARLGDVCPVRFNSCLLNRYASGAEGMAWHSDDEREMGRNAVIASLSFGATRKFGFRHKRSGEKREMMLRHGQLIVMRGETQSHWQHAILKTARVHSPRISLTFRTYQRQPSSGK